MEVHHKTMRSEGGTDAYKNLVFVTGAVHKLIHAKEAEIIEKYLDLLKQKSIDFVKLNNLRRLVGNCEISENK